MIHDKILTLIDQLDEITAIAEKEQGPLSRSIVDQVITKFQITAIVLQTKVPPPAVSISKRKNEKATN